MNIITHRVEALRAWMRENGLSAYIIPSTDPHMGEYVPDHWKTREWITGFNGSAGTAVVTLTRAALWTDSRYWLAAEEQTAGTPFEVIRCSRNVATAQEIVEWIRPLPQPLPREGGELAGAQWVIGIDGWCVDQDYAASLETAAAKAGFTLRTDVEPCETLWTQRPQLPLSTIELHPLSLAGRTVAEKLADTRAAIQKNGADALLVCQLDEIAWLLNLRGKDVHCTPVFISYLVVRREDAILYVHPSQVTPEVGAYLQENHILQRPYEAIGNDLGAGIAGVQVLQYAPSATNKALAAAISGNEHISFRGAPSPIPPLRAIKNPIEIEGFREAMLRDGVAMVKFLRYLSETAGLTEITADQKLTGLRAEQPGFRDISFDTIAGYGAHGAIVHYEATPATDIPLEPHGLLLLDSGAQYDCGTTDITRTIPLGPLTDEERRDYTLVLKGHIRLATAVFPEGTTGTQLDVLARYAMWQEHKNYGHGTGHGVGSYLSVHEGPHQFRMNHVPAPLQAGMTVTIEPGIYIAGSHGVRIENTMLITDSPPALSGVPLSFKEGTVTTDSQDAHSSAANSPSLKERGQGGESWLRLEPLTLCPIATEPIIREMLFPDEIDYLNRYHARVREALLPRLDDDADRQWLIAHTAPL